ncbi:serine/threonine-protein kinase [Kitasatospora sp. NPDC088134]|uniref:serine/threonine-protein kinase n=1 Tax=Kitasatospora sp. NPDC088134 TaxID=3364071 RepID=UPI00381698D1
MQQLSGGPAGGAGWRLPGYLHEGELGEGAAGRVVRARRERTGERVAIKYLTGGAASEGERLRTEARVLGALDSPHVVELYEYVEHPGGAALVMELVPGVSLRELLRAEGPTGPEAALSVLKGSLLGLAAAHEAGVVHRDYKPGNVLVTSDGTSKLVDFGIALPSGGSGGIAGTPAYMAPEQWAGAPASPTTDVYAATATFFECLTGEPPYDRPTVIEAALAHTEAEVPAGRVPEPVRALVRSGLAKRPADRPADAAALLAELEEAAVAAYGEEWEEHGRRRLALLAGLLAVAALGGGGSAAGGATSVATTRLLGPEDPRGPGSRTGGRHGRTAAVGAAGLAVLALVGMLLTDGRGTATGPGGGPEAAAAASDGVAGAPDPGAGGGSAAPTGRPAATGTSRPGPSAASTASTAPSATPPAGPGPVPSATGGPSGPAPSGPPQPSASRAASHVLSLALTRTRCEGAAAARVEGTVTTDGLGAGTLLVTWTDETGRLVATEPVTLPAGGVLVPFTSARQPFGPARTLTARVTADPPSLLGTDTTSTVDSATCAAH